MSLTVTHVAGRTTHMARMSFTHRVAANVRAEMARSQITQQALARRVKPSQQALSRRLAGYQAFNTDELQDIANALNVSVESLITGHPGVSAANSAPARALIPSATT